MIDGKVCTDPYAKEIAGREVFGKRQNDDKHGVRAKIQVSDYDWGEDRPIRHPWNEVVSYSIHVRGFTKHSSSKVLHRGTYQGVIEKIPYLSLMSVQKQRLIIGDMVRRFILRRRRHILRTDVLCAS